MMRGYCARGRKACEKGSWLKILLSSIERFCAITCELKPEPFTCIDGCNRITHYHTHSVALSFIQLDRQFTIIVC